MDRSKLIDSSIVVADQLEIPSDRPIFVLNMDWHRQDSDGNELLCVMKTTYENFRNLQSLLGVFFYVPLPSTPAASYPASAKGLIIGGGSDMHPRFYGQAPDGSILRAHSELRYFEAKESYLWAKGRGLPVLAICWGTQFLNVFYGGSLVQDLPDKIEHKMKLVELVLEKDSWISKAIDSLTITGFCSHHQGFLKIPERYKVVGRCRKGLPHVLEHVGGNTFELLYVQHPEACFSQPLILKLMKSFLEVCENWRAIPRVVPLGLTDNRVPSIQLYRKFFLNSAAGHEPSAVENPRQHQKVRLDSVGFDV